MAFNLANFFKKKQVEVANTPAASPPVTGSKPAPPPIPSANPAARPEISVSESIVKKIVPRQGSLAAALKAASIPSHIEGSQSAILKPKINQVVPTEQTMLVRPPTAPKAETTQPQKQAIHASAITSIDIPTSEIIPLLPENLLKSDALATLPKNISLVTNEILPQLAKGRVQVSLETLLSFFPQEAVDASVASSGDIKIKIPLQLIIPRLSPELISLPNNQIEQKIDPNIETPFSEKNPKATTQSPSAPLPSPLPKPPVAPVAMPPIPKEHTSLAPADATKELTQSIVFPTRPALHSASSEGATIISKAASPVPSPIKTPPLPPPSSNLPKSGIPSFKIPTMPASPALQADPGGATIISRTAVPSSPLPLNKPASLPVIPSSPVKLPPPATPPLQAQQSPPLLKIPSLQTESGSIPTAPASTAQLSAPPANVVIPSLKVASQPKLPPIPPVASSATVPPVVSKPLVSTPQAVQPPVPAQPPIVSQAASSDLPKPTIPSLKIPLPQPSAVPASPVAAVSSPTPANVVIPSLKIASQPKLPPPTPVPASTLSPSVANASPPVPPPIPQQAISPQSPVASQLPPSIAKTPSPSSASLQQLLGITEQQSLRIQDVATLIRDRFNLLGALIATEDGLPLVAAMPSEININTLSSVAPLLFKKFGKESVTAPLGEPRHCMLSMGTHWLTLLKENGIYLILSHREEMVTSEFESKAALLANQVGSFCHQQKTSP